MACWIATYGVAVNASSSWMRSRRNRRVINNDACQRLRAAARRSLPARRLADDRRSGGPGIRATFRIGRRYTRGGVADVTAPRSPAAPAYDTASARAPR